MEVNLYNIRDRDWGGDGVVCKITCYRIKRGKG